MTTDAGRLAGITPDILDHGLADDLAAASLSLARRFHAGATMWCVAPQWEPHAHHMAVEFVHPVIVGKRALPALALTAPDVVAQARVSVRPGDIVIAVAAADDAAVLDLMRRTSAWGALSVWIGSGGARPRRRGRPRAVDRRPQPARAGHRPLRADVPPAVGTDPRVLRAPGPARRAATPSAPTRCASPAATRAARPRWSCRRDGPFGTALVRTAQRRGARSTRPWSATSIAGDLLLVHAGSALDPGR